MKKNLKLFGLIALFAIAFSCSKEANQDVATPEGNDPEEQTVPVTEEPAADGNLLTSFSVTFENDAEGAPTKVSVDLGTGVTDIESDDEVLVVSSSESAVYKYNGEVFVPKTAGSEVTISDAGVSVYYPAGEFELTGNQVLFTMPAAILAADYGTINPMAGQITESEGAYTVQLCNMVSVLKVNVTAASEIQSVTLNYGSVNDAALNYGTGSKWSVDAANKTLMFVEGSATETAVSVSETSAEVAFILPAVELGKLTVTANQTTGQSISISRAGFTPTKNTISTMSFNALFSGGKGTEKSPYKIATAQDFKDISVHAANGFAGLEASYFLGAYYIQTAVIDFNGEDLSGYMIASASAPFTGTYDGDSKTLSNFSIEGSPSGNEGVALFKAINGATLQNISISGANVTGGKFTAGLVGYANGASLTITGCSISSSTISASGDYGAAGLIGGLYAGTVSSCSGTDLTIGATNTSGNKRYYGGLISYARGTTTVYGCSLNGTTTVNGTPAYFGGIAGQTNEDETTITGCENHSDISGAGNFAGGIVGIKTKGSIEGCTNDGSVGGAQYVGGIAGRNEAGNILGCTNEGDIVSTGIAGGIAGQVTGGTIKDCTNESSATFSVSGATVGGIAGTLTGGTITASDGRYTENKADIDLGVVEGKNNVGGIVGQLEGAITNVKNSGAITGYYNIGGIGGTITTNASVENALSSGNVSGYQNVGGISGKHGHNANAAITKKITLKNCHVDGADITASADDGRAGGIAGLVFAGSWIEGCTAFRGSVSGHQDVGGAIGHLQYASSSTDKSNRIYVGANLVSMDVSGLTPINNTSRIGGFFGWFQNNKDAYTFAYQNGVVGGSIIAEGCQYVGSFVGYASVSSNKGRIWDSYSLIEDSNFHVTTTNANIGGFAGGYGNANVNSVRNAHVNSQNTSAATSGITKTTVADIRTVNLGTSETPSCNVDGSAYTTTTWSNPSDVNYPVPTILVTYGHYK
jgi:hypothetical protein